jgi:hypothetical protein
MSRHEFSRSTKHSDEGADIVRKPTTFLPALALGIAGAISAASPSLADPITYTMQFLGTGSLGMSSFTQAAVTLTMDNDSANIVFDSSLGLYEINGTATVGVSGINGGAAATFSDTMQVFTDSVSLVGFFDASVNSPFGLDMVDQFSAAFMGYELMTIAPTTDTAQLGGGAPPDFPGFGTNDGDFLLTGLGDGTSATATFTATVAAVPAPPIGRGLSVAVAAGGLLFGAKRLLQRRRFRNPLT